MLCEQPNFFSILEKKPKKPKKPTKKPKTLKPSCNKNVDLGFIVDSSGSLGTVNYRKEKDFVEKMAAEFGLGNGTNSTQASVVTFSRKAVLNIKLNQYKTLKAFNAAVDKIPFMKSFTRIDLGMFYLVS